MESSNNDEDLPELSNAAFAALQEFYSEREQREQLFENLKANGAEHAPETVLSMEMFSEDWNASQFWYSDETAVLLARQLLQGCTSESKIAVVSAPSVFIQLQNLLALGSYRRPQIKLLEFDERFAVFKEFVRYDFQSPMKLPVDMRGKFDRIICDPPFLSSDCQTKAATTVRWLLKTPLTKPDDPSNRIIVCTGERMEEVVLQLYSGIHPTSFEPQHAQNRLSNAFRCFANYECEEWTWR